MALKIRILIRFCASHPYSVHKHFQNFPNSSSDHFPQQISIRTLIHRKALRTLTTSVLLSGLALPSSAQCSSLAHRKSDDWLSPGPESDPPPRCSFTCGRGLAAAEPPWTVFRRIVSLEPAGCDICGVSLFSARSTDRDRSHRMFISCRVHHCRSSNERLVCHKRSKRNKVSEITYRYLYL